MLKKILIANRGEIACRIIKTAKRLGIKTVIIYSQIDQSSLSVKLADEAYCVGEAKSLESYLNISKIIEVALKSKSEAIHPGYGFLAENEDFALQCEKNNIIFIGPRPPTIANMGNKNKAKEIMEKAGLPVVPGYHGELQDYATLQKAAKKIGFPLLIKASSGGGGKGMRLVESFEQFKSAFESTKREAQSSFGDDRIFLEKYIAPARHIELQIFADQFDNIVHLYTRDCSIQRRHQKIIEEAPAPNLSDTLKNKMAETAIGALKTMQYLGAGTIEFLVDEAENFYFMEMNTRLQVEHPVTEMITGLDLVEWQLRVAAKEKLPLTQKEIQFKGHAIEARIYAENPYQNFNPSAGLIKHCQFPEENKHVRIDTGIRKNDSISPYYDPLLAKLIVWENNRDTALTTLEKALSEIIILGVENNIGLLHDISKEEDFQRANLNTQFLNHHPTLLANPEGTEIIGAIAALAKIQYEQKQNLTYKSHSQDYYSPWLLRNDWNFTFWHNEKYFVINAKEKNNQYYLNVDNIILEAKVNWIDNKISGIINQHYIEASIIKQQEDYFIFYLGHRYLFSLLKPLQKRHDIKDTTHYFFSPMPATLTSVLIKKGDTVSPGQTLVILEAMKMEHALSAPTHGVIKEIYFEPGDLLNEGAEILLFEAS